MTCKVLLHHYGRSTSPPRRSFVGGLVATIDPVELERFSTIQVKIILTYSLGYDENSTTFLYLRKPNCSVDSGLVPLADALQDRNMLLMVAGKIQLFISHHQIDLSMVLIPNDGSLEEALEAHYKLQIYIDHLGVDFIIAKYIFPNVSLAELMKHVITNYTSDSEDNKREDHPLVDYGKYALGCMTVADMKKCVHLKSVRDELLRSMEEKRQLMANYRDM
uniref:Uncharacterized protein n=1 Tax=Tanacetum cinerariifolium TaxID=118510 RepID=A0A6L2LFK8_TANCI|nr:hypothetical protein [Tanacetum cinerariifolium]